MRLWSLHPKYLDTKGLLALWRESLLARKVLEGGTKGYKNHPQLLRFKATPDPVAAINAYLAEVFLEAQKRGFSFDASKLALVLQCQKISVSKGQVEYERAHLIGNLKRRAPDDVKRILRDKSPNAHPLFIIVDGDVEPWEKL